MAVLLRFWEYIKRDLSDERKDSKIEDKSCLSRYSGQTGIKED